MVIDVFVWAMEMLNTFVIDAAPPLWLAVLNDPVLPVLCVLFASFSGPVLCVLPDALLLLPLLFAEDELEEGAANMSNNPLRPLLLVTLPSLLEILLFPREKAFFNLFKLILLDSVKLIVLDDE